MKRDQRVRGITLGRYPKSLATSTRLHYLLRRVRKLGDFLDKLRLQEPNHVPCLIQPLAKPARGYESADGVEGFRPRGECRPYNLADEFFVSVIGADEMKLDVKVRLHGQEV